jgi:hypothetical protein
MLALRKNTCTKLPTLISGHSQSRRHKDKHSIFTESVNIASKGQFEINKGHEGIRIMISPWGYILHCMPGELFVSGPIDSPS